MAVKAVFFDVGETLVDESRAWAAMAEALSVTQPTLLGILGATIERGAHHRETFAIIGATSTPAWQKHERCDLYPDAEACLRELRAAGYVAGVAGNQPWSLEDLFGSLVDHVLTAATVGAEKPSPRFFEKIVEVAGVRTREIAYVGDRVDNDVLPALEAGMVAVHIRRGPWGYLQGGSERAHVCIGSLGELPEALADV